MKRFFNKKLKGNLYSLSNILDYFTLIEIKEIIFVNSIFLQSFGLLNERTSLLKDVILLSKLKSIEKLLNFNFYFNDPMNVIKSIMDDNSTYNIMILRKLYDVDIISNIPSFLRNIKFINDRSQADDLKNSINKNVIFQMYNILIPPIQNDEHLKYICCYLKNMNNLNSLKFDENSNLKKEHLKKIIDSIVQNNLINKFELILSNVIIDLEILNEIKISLKEVNYNRKISIKFLICFDEFEDMEIINFKNEYIDLLINIIKDIKYKEKHFYYFTLDNCGLTSEVLKYFFNDRKSIESISFFDFFYNSINKLECLKDYCINANSSKQIYSKKINLSFNKLKDSDIFHLFFAIGKGIHLEEINLSNNCLSEECLIDIVENLKNLYSKKKLKMSNSLTKKISDQGMFENLKVLNLSTNLFSDKGDNMLSQLLQFGIEELYLAETGLSYPIEFFKELNSNHSLKILDLSGNPLLANNLNELSESFLSSNLMSINLDYCSINDSNTELIKNLIMSNVTKISIKSNSFSNNILKYISEIIVFWTNKKKGYRLDLLNLSSGKLYNNLSLNSFFKGFNSDIDLIKNIEIKELRFSNDKNKSDTLIIDELIIFCMNNVYLKNLDLSYNSFNNEMSIKLMLFILKFSKIQHLNLRGNYLNDKGVELLGQIFQMKEYQNNFSIDKHINNYEKDNKDYILNIISAINDTNFLGKLNEYINLFKIDIKMDIFLEYLNLSYNYIKSKQSIDYFLNILDNLKKYYHNKENNNMLIVHLGKLGFNFELDENSM